MLRLLICWVAALSLAPGYAQHGTWQDSLFTLPDPAAAFTLQDYMDWVQAHHPVSQQADLLTEFATQAVRQARGSFDPKAMLSWNTKQYEDYTYYERLSGSIKFPTRSPITPSLNIDRNHGTYLNPEQYVGNAFDYWQYSAGISIPLGRGLLTDERRAALQQAKLMISMNEAERTKIINKLLLDAAKNYWQWCYAYYHLQLLNRSVAVAERIFERVHTHHALGEAAAIDTVQAYITWQQQYIERTEAAVEFQNATIALSTALWDSTGMPMQAAPHWTPAINPAPAVFPRATLDSITNMARAYHPELQKIRIKTQQLEVDKKLATEFLKPELNVSYYALNQPVNPNGDVYFDPTASYKLGIDFSMPLLLRKERAKLAITKLKLSNITYAQSLAARQIKNDLEAAYNELITMGTLVSLQGNLVNAYELLLQAEILNLQEGESDLFKINVQQNKLIETYRKWLKLLVEFQKQRAYLYWRAGLPSPG